MTDPVVDIFTDGACSGNPGPGGWGALLRYGAVEKELCGGTNPTTNNRMEMTAAIEALEALKKPVQNIDLWLRLEAALKPHTVEWFWVKGHAGHVENERADALARQGVLLGLAAAETPK